METYISEADLMVRAKKYRDEHRKSILEKHQLSRTHLKDEVFNCPPVLVITGRIQDNWLAAWSKAEDAILHPIDPFTLASKVAALLQDKTIISA